MAKQKWVYDEQRQTDEQEGRSPADLIRPYRVKKPDKVTDDYLKWYNSQQADPEYYETDEQAGRSPADADWKELAKLKKQAQRNRVLIDVNKENEQSSAHQTEQSYWDMVAKGLIDPIKAVTGVAVDGVKEVSNQVYKNAKAPIDAVSEFVKAVQRGSTAKKSTDPYKQYPVPINRKK